MLPLLRIMLVHLWVACIAGAVVIAGLVMGYVNAATFIWAAVIGLALGIPGGLLNWAYLRPNRLRQIGWTWPVADWVRGVAPGRRT